MSLTEEVLINLFNPKYELTLVLPLTLLLLLGSSKRQRNSQESSFIWSKPWPPLPLAGLNWLPNLLLVHIITIYIKLRIADQELEKNRKLCIADQSRAKEEEEQRGRMTAEGGGGYRLSGGGAMTWFGVVMVAVVIAIAVAVVFLVCLYLNAKWYLRRHRPSHSNHDINNPISGSAGGLEASILRSLPVVSFKAGDVRNGLECSVCLCEVSEGEKARLLPSCNHGFHLECIDMWFRSHSTCPLCRSPVSPAAVPGHAPPETTMDIPTNVLFWGNDDQVNAGGARVEDGSTSPSTSSSTTSSSSGDGGGKIAVDVARQSVGAAEESPRSPAARLRSFRKLFNREGRSMARSTREEGEGDVEQGMAKL